MRARIAASAALVFAAAGAALGQIFVEGFDNGSNVGGWSFGAPVEGIQPAGGNPGAYLRGSSLDTTIPFLRTTSSSIFTGNYAGSLVTNVSVSLNVFHTDFNIGSRAPAVILRSFNGTPGDPSDDWGAYKLASLPLAPTGQWTTFDFAVPSSQTSLPAGWGIIQFGPSAPANPEWGTLMQGVDQLMFSFGDPTLFYIFQMWDVGADNAQIAFADLCYANCDNSTTAPVLNVNDFICFQTAFAAGNSYANCDGSTTQPVLNVNDFICFQTKFAAGCTP